MCQYIDDLIPMQASWLGSLYGLPSSHHHGRSPFKEQSASSKRVGDGLSAEEVDPLLLENGGSGLGRLDSKIAKSRPNEAGMRELVQVKRGSSFCETLRHLSDFGVMLEGVCFQT